MSKILDISIANPRNALNRAKNLNPSGSGTEDSQAISSQNARIPTLRGLHGEDSHAISGFRDSLIREYRPATTTENLLVEMIAQNQLMLYRVRHRETIALDADPTMSDIKSFIRLQTYTSHYESAIRKDIEVLRKLQGQRVPTPLPPDPPSPAPKTPLSVVPKGIFSVTSETEDGRFSTRPTPIRTPRRRRLPEKKVA